jgi:hypothetical protein
MAVIDTFLKLVMTHQAERLVLVPEDVEDVVKPGAAASSQSA